MNDYAADFNYPVAEAEPDVRASFIRKTYMHLAGAILVFIVLESALINSPVANMFMGVVESSRYSWLFVLGAFMGVSWLADTWAKSDHSRGIQYFGLGIFIFAESFIFLPMVMYANIKAGGGVFIGAGFATLALFIALTLTVFTTKRDFSFLGPIVMGAALIAFGVIACSIIFGFSLGIIFSGVMVLIAGGSILYSTSNVLHHYRPTQHVAASLSLFAGIALLFYYVLRIFTSRD